MNRIGSIEIAGKAYPLNFSMSVAERMAEKYGCVEDVWNYIQGKPYREMIGEFLWILALLIEQGCKYKQVVENETIDPLSVEKLEICMSVSEIVESQDIIMKTMITAMTPEVELDEIKKKAKTMAQEWMRQASHGRSITVEPSASPVTNIAVCP